MDIIEYCFNSNDDILIDTVALPFYLKILIEFMWNLFGLRGMNKFWSYTLFETFQGAFLLLVYLYGGQG